ncbi:MAG TPA: CHC2 zinc finger domain-containing protein [Pirellulaceae bacterium]|nr:CHC2 zinc finger domain-containing protein [Pirellulaceae bacterium]
MPGVDFNRLRSEITMEQVLNMIRFEPSRQSGDQWYGCCPLHNCTSKNRRCFSVNVATGRYYCHRCHRHGNQLELWAAFTGKPLYQAAIDFCHVLGREVPWIRRW